MEPKHNQTKPEGPPLDRRRGVSAVLREIADCVSNGRRIHPPDMMIAVSYLVRHADADDRDDLIGTIESAIAVGRTLADSDARGVGEGFTF